MGARPQVTGAWKQALDAPLAQKHKRVIITQAGDAQAQVTSTRGVS